MIRAPGVPGVAFGTVDDGDARSDSIARASIARELGIPTEWATVSQIHGDTVVVAGAPGFHGDADGIFTTTPMLPLTVATADCVPVALVGDRTVAVIHAGWRGVAAGIVASALKRFAEHGDDPKVAVIGPHIGSCCYEVGEEVVEAIGGFEAETAWGTRSVDLGDAIVARLGDVPVTRVGGCTREDAAFASHRENATPHRQVSVVWLP